MLSPKNPLFHRYLSEALVAILKQTSKDDLKLLSVIDAMLFPIFRTVLSNHIIEIFPSIFQLLAQFIELSRQPIPPYYMKFFELILLGDHWREPSHVPSIVILLRAFLQRASIELIQNQSLIKLIHIVDLLVSSPITEVGFLMLNVLLDNLEYDDFKPLAAHIWQTLFMLLLLQNDPTVKFLKSFVKYISLFLIKHGAAKLEQSMNSVRPDMFVLVANRFWMPSVKLINDATELKLAGVASIMLHSGSPTLLDASGAELWGEMLDSIVTLLMQLKHCKAEKGQSFLPMQDTEGSSATFIHLNGLGKKEDPLTDIKDTHEFLVASLKQLCALSPGKYPRIIKKSLHSCNQAALEVLCSTYNGAIV